MAAVGALETDANDLWFVIGPLLLVVADVAVWSLRSVVNPRRLPVVFSVHLFERLEESVGTAVETVLTIGLLVASVVVQTTEATVILITLAAVAGAAAVRERRR